MNKVLKGISCALVMLACTGCAFQTSFDNFKTKANEALSRKHPYTTACVKGKTIKDDYLVSDEANFKWVELLGVGSWVLDGEANESSATCFNVLSMNLGVAILAKIDTWTYSVGLEFAVTYKTDNEYGEAHWNSYGLITHYSCYGNSGNGFNFNVAYE